jgi:hypothetical protein
MFCWGLWSYEPYHLSVDHGRGAPGQAVTDYQISIANKQYHDENLRVRVSGLDPQYYRLSADAVTLGKVQRESLTLSISPQIRHGLYPVQVEVLAQDGWVGRFQFQHFAD